MWYKESLPDCNLRYEDKSIFFDKALCFQFFSPCNFKYFQLKKKKKHRVPVIKLV